MFACALLSLFPAPNAHGQESQENKLSLDPSQLALYGSIITAVSAVGGGIAGSVLTFRHNIKIEEFRNNQKQSGERKKERE
jgi:hypothetical protein